MYPSICNTLSYRRRRRRRREEEEEEIGIWVSNQCQQHSGNTR